VSADATALEKAASAIPFAIFKFGGVIIIVTPKGHFERIKGDSITFFCITFGFIYLSNHSRIHFLVLAPYIDIFLKQKHAPKKTGVFTLHHP